MSHRIDLLDIIESNFSFVMAALIILCYSLFLSTSFVSVGKASQEGITTTKVNAVSSKVIAVNSNSTAVNSNSTPSSNMASYKVKLSSSKLIPVKNAVQLPQSLLLSYTVTNTQGVSSESVLSANTNGSSNAPNNNVVPHIQRTISNVTR